MGIKKVLLLILFFFILALVVPKTSKAIDLQEALTSENSIITKVQEGVEYFFAFQVENKIQVLEKHADKRLNMAKVYAEKGANERVQDLVEDYGQIKERQNNLMDKVDREEVLGLMEERTIEQQRTMEEIKTKTDENTKQEVVRVQEQVVNQVAKHVVEVNGPEGTTEFLNEVIHVWAPGTGPGGGEAGVVYAGGGKVVYAEGTGPGEGGVIIEGGAMQFAPGTSAGSPSGADIETNVVITGGGENNVVEGVDGGGFAPGTTGDSTGNTIDPGTVDEPADGGGTWLAP